MFGKTLQFQKGMQPKMTSIADVFYPRGRGRYMFLVQTRMPEVHTKMVWFEQDPETLLWAPKSFGEKRGPRAAVIVATARELDGNGWPNWTGSGWYNETLRARLKDVAQQRCLIAVYDISFVKKIVDEQEKYIYPGPDGKFPPQYEAIPAQPRNKPFVLEISGGQLYDQHGDIVGKSSLADLMRALRDASTIDPFSGEMVQVDLTKQPVMMVVSGEGKETQRKFSVITMPPKPITVDMDYVYDLRSWPQPASAEMLTYMMETGGNWREICQKFSYQPFPELIPYTTDDEVGEELPETGGDEDIW
jgi:hypothetical protein